MKNNNLQDEIQMLKKEIQERQLDHYYADSWEQAAQITKDIEKMEQELKSLLEKY